VPAAGRLTSTALIQTQLHSNGKESSMRIMKGRVTGWAGVLGVLAAAVACNDTPPPKPKEAPPAAPDFASGERPECPRFWEFNVYMREDFVGSIPGPLPLSGELTNIPEFNDCQRFIDPRSQGYDSLYAIFVSRYNIRDTTFTVDGDGRSGVALLAYLQQRPPVRLGIAVATIYAIGNEYDPLGIKRGLNCLYLSQTAPNGPFQAAIAAIPDGNCDQPNYQGPVTVLDVVRTALPNPDTADYPRAARWQTDSTGTTYVAGVPCDRAWCEVGPMGFRPAPPLPAAPNASTEVARRFAIKGWYDEQRLGVLEPDTTPGTPRRTVPTQISGLVVPVSQLGRYDQQDYANNDWLPAARIYLRGTSPEYDRKLNASCPDFTGAVPSGPGSLIELCMGDSIRCGIPPNSMPPAVDERREQMAATQHGVTLETDWWARITRGGGAPAYRRVTRCPHPGIVTTYGFGVAGTARWRWQANDETVWVRCAEGCCEVHPWEI
jgi:hypothetical protein